MKLQLPALLVPVVLGITACGGGVSSEPEVVKSSNGEVVFSLKLASGTPEYELSLGDKPVIKPSKLGFKLTDGSTICRDMKLDSVSRSSFSETWKPVWGENDSIRNEYNQMTMYLTGKNDLKVNIEVRAFDDGVGFRYVFPKQKLDSLHIAEELTEFAMPSDLTAWWIPGDYDTQEYEYIKTPLSGIRAANEKNKHIDNVSQTGFSPTGVQTSLLMRDDTDSLYINIHEAALVNYPAMHLNLDDKTLTFTSWLTPGRSDAKADIALPFATPWRVIMLGSATDILATDIVYNLNEPCALDDVSWIHPTKYMGVWWEMITGKSQWSYTNMDNVDLATVDYSTTTPHGLHGATNENVKRYIDFAAANGFDELLIEGWNIGWEDWFGKEKDFVFDFVTPYPDFDIKMLNDYAHSKGIKLMMHHETSGSVPNYEAHLDTAYKLMNQFGYDAVKSGYVGSILPKGETHYSQNMVNHYLNAVKKAADYKIMVNGHEAVRPTGLARTYPNLVGNESAMGTEYRQMSPQHVTILPFTRLKGGPMDFTPGIFEADMSTFVPGSKDRKKATVANQLALYVTMYSPLQMAADMPEHYAAKADAFQFIKDVPVDWSKSIYLAAVPGEFIVAARRDKKSADWYVGGVANEPTQYTVDFSFLEPGATYAATIYRDADNADGMTNPAAYTIEKMDITSATKLPIKMARAGGFAISLKKK